MTRPNPTSRPRTRHHGIPDVVGYTMANPRSFGGRGVGWKQLAREVRKACADLQLRKPHAYGDFAT